MFLLTLAVDQDESAEIDREMRRRGDVEPPYVRFHLKTRRWVSSDYNDSVFCKEETSTAIGMVKEKKKRLTCKTEKSQKIKSRRPRKSDKPQYLWGCFEGVFVQDLTRLGMREGVFVPDLTRSAVRVRGLGLVWTSGPTRSDRDQHQTRSRTRHRNLTRLVSYVLLKENCTPKS